MSDDESLTQLLATTAGMREIVYSQTRVLDVLLESMKQQLCGEAALPKGDPRVFLVLLRIIQMVGISGHSILKLTDGISPGVKDAYPVVRGIIEGAVNACYIMAGGTKVAERASRHAEVTTYRDLRREWKVGEMRVASKWLGTLPPEEIQRLEAMVPEFTTKSGRETSWTSHNLKERLETIEKEFPRTAMIALVGSAFNTYRLASEVIHGTYYSALFFLGITTPRRTSHVVGNQLELTLANHQFSVLSSTILSYTGIIQCFSTYAGVPELLKIAEAQLDRLRALPCVAEDLAESE